MTERKQKALGIVGDMFPQNLVEQISPGPSSDFGSELGNLGMEALFEPVWTREGIDLRTRSLVTVSMLIALRAYGELAIHVPAAIRNGATVAEIEEVIYHAAGYAGFPAAVSAREVAQEALAKANMLD